MAAQSYYTNRALNFVESKGKWRGRLYHWDESGKRRERSRIMKARGKRAATAEFLAWCDEEERLASESNGAYGDAAANMTVADYCERYITMREGTGNIEPSTVRGYKTSFGYIRQRFSSVAVRDLAPRDIEAWIAGLNRRGLSSSSIGKAYRLLKMVMNDAVTSGAIPRNPLDTVKPPKRMNKARGINALDTAARSTLLDKLACIKQTPTTVGATIALYTGLRRAEVCALKWRDLDVNNSVVWVRRAIGNGTGGAYIKEPKTDKSRDVAIPPTLSKTLEAWREEQRERWRECGATFDGDSFIIGDPLGFYQPDRLSREWHTLAQTLDIRGVEGRVATFHDLRHTWATMYLASGGDVNTAASNLGHAKPSMTLDVYASADPDAKRRAAEIVEQAMRGDQGKGASHEMR